MKTRLLAAAAGFVFAFGTAAQARSHHAHAGTAADRSCLVPAAQELLARIEANFGPVSVISTCRPHAVVAGSHRPSLHRYGLAIDFRTARKAEVVKWLIANHQGGTMTYSHKTHIHVDVGPHFVGVAGYRRVVDASRNSFARAYARGGGKRADAGLARTASAGE